MSENAKQKKSAKIGTWFRELKSEMKKVVWPTPKTVVKNTGIVIMMVLVIGAFIWVADFIFRSGLAMIINK